MITPDLRREYRFQQQHGVGSVGHQAEWCLNAALAYLTLQDAIDEGLAEVCWEWDDDPDLSWMDTRQLEDLRNERTFMLAVVLKIEGEIAASLCGIHASNRYAGDPYCHIIESELAAECLNALHDALRGVEDATDRAY